MGNAVTECGQKYKNRNMQRDLWYFYGGSRHSCWCKVFWCNKVYDKRKWTYWILFIGHLATASACTSITQKDAYFIFDPHSRNTYGRPIDGGTSIVLHFNLHEECCNCWRKCSHDLPSNQFDRTVIMSTRLLVTYLEDHNAWQKKKDQLTKRERVALRKERICLQICEWHRQVEYKENEKVQGKSIFN